MKTVKKKIIIIACAVIVLALFLIKFAGLRVLPKTSEVRDYLTLSLIHIVPQLEIYGYSTVLRSMTGGSGEFSYEFARYEQAPADVQAREIEARAKAVSDAEEM